MKRIQRSFSGGEISPFTTLLTNIRKRQDGLAKAQNTIIKKFGAIENRVGTEFWKDLTTRGNGRMTSFLDSNGNLFLVYFAVGTWVAYNQEGVRQGHGVTFLNSNDLKRLRFSQQADVLIVTSIGHFPLELKKVGDTWTFSNLRLVRPGPLFSNFVATLAGSGANPPGGTNSRSYDFALTGVLRNGEESTPLTSSRVGDPDRGVLFANLYFQFTVTENAAYKSYNLYIREGGAYYLLNRISPGGFGSNGYRYIGEPHDPSQTLPLGQVVVTAPNTPVTGTNLGRYDSIPRFPALVTGTTEFTGTVDNVSDAVLSSNDFFRFTPVQSKTFTLADGPYFAQVANAGLDIVRLKTERGGVSIYNLKNQLIQAPSTFPQTNASFFDVSNNPSISHFYGQRLLLGNTYDEPEKIWVSGLGSYRDFSDFLNVTERSPYDFSIASKDFNPIKAIAGLREPILFGGRAEWSLGQDISAIQITPSPQSGYGIGDLAPEEVENTILFLEGKNIVRDYLYNFQTGGYRGNDLTVFSSHLFEGRTVVSMSFQKEPDPILWVVLDNGKVLSLSYFLEQNIAAWCRHDFGGTVLQVEVLPGEQEQIPYFLIKRDSNYFIERIPQIDRTDDRQFRFADSHRVFTQWNTNTARTVFLSSSTTGDDEFTPRDMGINLNVRGFNITTFPTFIDVANDKRDVIRFEVTQALSQNNYRAIVHDAVPRRFFQTNAGNPDAIIGHSTSNWAIPTNRVFGLTHLASKQVSIFADGSVVAGPKNPKTVSAAGALDLGDYYSVICVGLPYVSDLKTLPIDLRGDSTIIDQNIIINKVIPYVHNTRGLFIGATEPNEGASTDGLDPLKTNFDGKPEVTPEQGRVAKVINAKWTQEGEVFIRQIDPLPFNIQGIVVTGDFAGFRPQGN